MITKEIAAVLALYVYEKDVAPINFPLISGGWEKLPDPLPVTDGFAYGVFRNATTNEVVIAYRGTDGVVEMMGADGANNIGLTLGQATSQAVQAAKVYAKVLELYGSDANGSNISFTGHSLGGGLAGVMGVWFNRPAFCSTRHLFRRWWNRWMPRTRYGQRSVSQRPRPFAITCPPAT